MLWFGFMHSLRSAWFYSALIRVRPCARHLRALRLKRHGTNMRRYALEAHMWPGMPRAPKRQTVAKRNITREGLESFVIIDFKASCAISVQMVEMKNIRIP